ncbi:flagellar FlbD family protein [Brevibacillus dissolubilis]|uniref:flagellar FlbD family protein n=1 Tax=Brevibacillus dissolubilis TaxID=1844116 RepID=UPI001115F0D5|nr:flagellar FlbD family protein [Brevibacillus dissolubilis]
MIEVTRFNGGKIFLNAAHIELVEATPDTIITLTNGKKYIVKENAQEVAGRVATFYQTLNVATVIPRPSGESKE